MIFKRYSSCNTDCSNSCNSCSSSSCSSSCNSCISNNCCQDCCQNQCNVCQTSSCQHQSSCQQCCQTHCSTPEPCSNITTTLRTTTESQTTTQRVTIGTRPTPAKVVETRSQTIKESMSIDTKNDVRNHISSNNHVHVPIKISNVNVLRLTSSSHHESKPITSLTPGPPGPTPSTQRPHTTTKSPDSHIIIMQNPIHTVQPVSYLPCYSGSSCHQTRPYWSGQICNSGSGYGHLGGSGGGYGDWGGYGGYGFGHGLNWGYSGGGGCRSVQQDCNYCGSDFYNDFSHDSQQFSACYGCFI